MAPASPSPNSRRSARRLPTATNNAPKQLMMKNHLEIPTCTA
ncbi:MAG: hypothetical protein R2698_10040 [Microthrixaceae bacterium]